MAVETTIAFESSYIPPPRNPILNEAIEQINLSVSSPGGTSKEDRDQLVDYVKEIISCDYWKSRIDRYDFHCEFSDFKDLWGKILIALLMNG